MILQFSLEEMQEILKNAQMQTNIYSDAITTLDITIKSLASAWISDETKTYEVFAEKYKEKRQELLDARNHMIRFCNKLSEKIEEFNDAGNEVKNSFQ